MAGGINLNHGAIQAMLSSEDGPVAALIERKALAVENLAKRFAPVDTGRLRASITHRLVQGEGGISAVIGSDVIYAAYVEFGTYKMAAQPFLRPALVAVQSGAGALNDIYEASVA